MRFLEYLVEEEVLSKETLEDAMRQHGRKKRDILQALLSRSVLDPQTLLQKISTYYKLTIVDLEAMEKDPAARQLIPFDTAKRYGIFPIKTTGKKLLIATSDPVDFFTLDDLRFVSGQQIECVLCPALEVEAAIERYYHIEEDREKAVQELSILNVGKGSFEGELPICPVEDSNSPISKTVQRILEDAIQRNASDIHFEPQENEVELRYRIDGDLMTVQSLPLNCYMALVARIKILSRMDIAEKRKPQDGRARLVFRERKIDLRISTLLTIFGEKVVIRLLNQESLAVDSLNSLQFDVFQKDAYLKAISSKQGIVLITGPTGSGKTTTLYTSLNHIKSKKSNITTIEDPIEYMLGGVNQTQINPKIGVTFASTLRSILRQDPDVILVGEIRDRETADMAFRSSLTGHLVFSTLHTNSAIGAVTRLYDLGLASYLIGSALTCVVAQRLVRAICPDCRETFHPESALIESFADYLPQNKPIVFYRGRGCSKCAQTGFRGRVAIFEVLPILDELRSAISDGASEQLLYRKARRQGFKIMVESAIEKASKGLIALEDSLPFLPTYEKKENNLLKELELFLDANPKDRLLVVKNENLARKIILHAAPEDYTIIENHKDAGNGEINLNENNVPFPPAIINADPARSVDCQEKNESSDRRRHPRIARDFVVKYRSSGPKPSVVWEAAIVKNLSAEGCYFQAAQNFPVGKELEIHVKLPTFKEMISVKGVVRHCDTPATDEEFHFLGISFKPQELKTQEFFKHAVDFFLNKKSPSYIKK